MTPGIRRELAEQAAAKSEGLSSADSSVIQVSSRGRAVYSYEAIAGKIADRLLTINGETKQATMLTPSYIEGGEEKRAGSYCRSEIIEAILEVLK